MGIRAYCSAPECTWEVRVDSLAKVFEALVEHDEESGHPRQEHGHIRGL
jgi:predicted small metal-binding protein